jgi:hypothetical protein
MGGESNGPPTAVSCQSTREVEAGGNYGTYSVFAVRVDLDIAPGSYSIWVESGDEGLAYVFRDEELLGEYEYDPTLSLEDNTEQTIAFAGLFELDLRSQSEPDLSALDESLFDGCHLIEVGAGIEIEANQSYGDFLVEEIVVDDDAANGSYTFFAGSGNDGTVELRLDGVALTTLDYPWQTTIGGGASFTFEFPGVLSLTVTRPAGTSNLFGLASELFDGRHTLLVEQ